jgi:hypothetical protein
VALCQARISTKPLWGFSSSNPYPTQSRAEQGGHLKRFWRKKMFSPKSMSNLGRLTVSIVRLLNTQH